MLSNPPFGVDWKNVQKVVTDEHQNQGHAGRLLAGRKTEDLVVWAKNDVPDGFFLDVDDGDLAAEYTEVMLWAQRSRQFRDAERHKSSRSRLAVIALTPAPGGKVDVPAWTMLSSARSRSSLAFFIDSVTRGLVTVMPLEN